MMNPTISKLPLAAGHSVLTATMRTSGWAWGKFMAAPMQNLGLGFIGIAMVISATNALYWQNTAHPAPFFATTTTTALNVQNVGEIMPLLQAPHPLELAVGRASDLRSVIQPVPVAAVSANAPSEVTNEMLANAQTILTSMGLFTGKIDGFYGPQTAEAIRAFELQAGLPPKGALDSIVIQKINNSTLPLVLPTSAAPLASLNVVPKVTFTPVVSNEPVIQPAQDVLVALASNVSIASLASTAVDTPILATPVNPEVDKTLIERIQFGLSNLGFYHSSLDGIAGESTAKAIREFENFLSFEMTGRISSDVQQWLIDAGAYL